MLSPTCTATVLLDPELVQALETAGLAQELQAALEGLTPNGLEMEYHYRENGRWFSRPFVTVEELPEFLREDFTGGDLAEYQELARTSRQQAREALLWGVLNVIRAARRYGSGTFHFAWLGWTDDRDRVAYRVRLTREQA